MDCFNDLTTPTTFLPANLPACSEGSRLAMAFLQESAEVVKHLDGDLDRVRMAVVLRLDKLLDHRAKCPLCNEE